MVPALGSAEKNKITEYKDVRALHPLPQAGGYPHHRALPRGAQQGLRHGLQRQSTFKLYMPPRTASSSGPNDHRASSPRTSSRTSGPQHFLEALLVRPVDPASDKVLLENFTDEDNAFYILQSIRERRRADLHLSRTIWFNRLESADRPPVDFRRQRQYPHRRALLAIGRAYDNVPFPKHIEINRPQRRIRRGDRHREDGYQQGRIG